MSATAYSPAVLWGVILAASLGTYAMRVSFLHLFGRVDEIPDTAARALSLVPAAVLAALVVPRLLVADGSLALDPSNHQLLAGGVAAAVAWRTGSLLATVGVGLGALWALSLVLG